MKKLVIAFLAVLSLQACTAQVNSDDGNGGSGVVEIDTYRKANDLGKYAEATFAGGCFWCTEASFERIQGVVDVVSGYSGGEKAFPTYKEVSYSKTDHAEAIQVFYDPERISYQKLLEIFFTAHDPTQLNRQGPDVGPQYRSAIFYQDDEQRQQARAYMDKLAADGVYDKEIVTELTAYDTFWVAEEYHQNYYVNNPGSMYIQRVSKPKVKKVEKRFASILKEEYK